MAHHLANGLHKRVGCFDDPVQVADVSLDSLFPHMDGGDLANPLPGVEKKQDTFPDFLLRCVAGWQRVINYILYQSFP